eukprot:2829770-Rhodomonas_salina.1
MDTRVPGYPYQLVPGYSVPCEILAVPTGTFQEFFLSPPSPEFDNVPVTSITSPSKFDVTPPKT